MTRDPQFGNETSHGRGLLDDSEFSADDTNFSYNDVDIRVEVKRNQQMIIHDIIDINDTLILEGDLILEI